MKRSTCLVIAVFILLSCSFVRGVFAEDNQMVNIKGSYGMAAGFETDSFIWKDAAYNYQEKNWRYIDTFDSVNTYDKRIFDRYQLEITTDTRTPWNGYAEIVIDPWTFVGRGTETIENGWGDTATLDYRYWENTGKVLNMNTRTSAGNSLGWNEIKVIGGRVVQTNAAPSLWGSPDFVLSKDNDVKIDYFYRPVRKLWVEYKEEPLYIKVFPIASQAEALTADDPLILSNKHSYWAPSPWLYNFDPGMLFTGGTVSDARWDPTLAFAAQDSNREFLTFLRGGTMMYNNNIADFAITAATPLSLWDYYQEVDSVPIAARLKIHPSEKLQLGVTWTNKTGIAKQDVKATNNVGGVDLKYTIMDDTFLYGEFAGSYSDYEYANLMRQGYGGLAYKAGVSAKNEITAQHTITWDTSFTAMSTKFDPGLSEYRDTREDRDWGRHIIFEKIAPDDENDRIGDSIDQNRYVLGLTLRASLYDNVLDLYFNWRNVRDYQNNKFIENIVRFEPTVNPTETLQFKGIMLLRQYPNSRGFDDPFLRDRFTDDPWKNYSVEDGYNTNLQTWGGGAKIDLFDKKVTIYGVIETTNDPQNFPRGIVNTDSYNTTFNADDTDGWLSNSDLLFNRIIEAVYASDVFDNPPYEFTNIYKGKITYRPYDNFAVSYTHVTNGNKNYGPLFDDNHNHDAIDLAYRPLERLILRAGWSLSRMWNLRREIDTNGGDRPYEYHSNVYAQAEYDVNKEREQKLVVQFGEFGLLSSDLGLFGGPVVSRRYTPSAASVLDTRAILRLFYYGKF